MVISSQSFPKLALPNLALPLLVIMASVGWAGVEAPKAQAATLSFAKEGVDGVFVDLVNVAPGEYGFEGRGGYADQPNRTWELGVGTQTSHLGTFNQADIVWGSTPFDFEMSWNPGSAVSVKVGSQVLSYNANWLVGNAIQVIAKRKALLSISEVDGQSLPGSIGSINGTTLEKLHIVGDSLLDGWTIKGQIQLAPGKGSDNEVLITSGNFLTQQSVPEPFSTVALLLTAGAGIRFVRRSARA